MKYVRMLSSGAARITTYVAPMEQRANQTMSALQFLMDTGATRTVINKWLLNKLGYDDCWIEKNKIILTEEQKPTLADGRKLDAFGIPAMRLTIDEHEILHNDYFLSAYNAPNLSFLLGADILSYFDIIFKYSEWRVYYEFRKDRLTQPSKTGASFAHKAELGRSNVFN